MSRFYHKLQQKYIVCTATCITLTLLYGSRYALSTVIPHLIYIPEPSAKALSEGDICRSAGTENNSGPAMVGSEYLSWTRTEKLLVLGSFYLGYAMFTCLSGVVSDKLGGKYPLSVGIVGSCIASAATPSMLTKPPWYGGAAMQFILGMTQGMSAPAIMNLMAHWIPRNYHTLLVPYGYSGGCLGGMMSGVLSTYFAKALEKWQIIFYIWAGLLIIWFCVIVLFIYSRPSTHPYLSEDEREVLYREVGSDLPTTIPWKHIVQDSAVWALVIGQSADSFLKFTWYSHLPLFFRQVLGLKTQEYMYVYIIAYGSQWLVTIGASIVSDILIKKGYVPLIYMRCICAAIGNILPNILMMVSTQVGCSKLLIVASITTALASKGTAFVAFKPNILDITRHYAGVIQGFHNTLPTVVGIFVPYLTGSICEEFTVEAWRKVHWFSLTFCTSTTVFYLIYCAGKRAQWDVIEGEEVIKRATYNHWNVD